MTPRRAPSGKKAKVKTRVCPNCAMILEKPAKRCPRCNAAIAKAREENVTDKAGADSFPASDPPPYR